MPRPRLIISRDVDYDYFSAIEFGSVDDGQPADAWCVLEEQVGLLYEQDRCVGCRVEDFATFDPDLPQFESIWTRPRFDVPQLGLSNVTAGEICVAGLVAYAAKPTLNRRYFDRAVAAGGRDERAEAAKLWRCCLEAGDLMGHYGLGYTLYELEDFRGAYRHLRAYTEVTPSNAWAWSWLGRACIALGEHDEARAALGTAMQLEAEGGEETDAPELLECLS